MDQIVRMTGHDIMTLHCLVFVLLLMMMLLSCMVLWNLITKR